jgi:hypothetical protein
MATQPTVQTDNANAGAGQTSSAEFEALYVQSARRATAYGDVLTLHDLAPSTLMFSDRPKRIAGHLTTKQFVEGWGHGENSFLDDPPNAVLSFLGGEQEEAPEDVVVTLTNPRLEWERITYDVDVLEGRLPAATGPCSLFIDPVGRPLSPVSVMGVRRRSRRRSRGR